MTPTLFCGDALTLELPGQFDLVYADPPYAGCRFKYARKNNSRQWGRDARADFLRELIARIESLRSENGVGALSMGTPELRLLHLFPTKARVFAWVKPYAPNRPGVWPTFAWEPVVAWGRFPNREEQRLSATPKDWLQLSPAVPKRGPGEHENPKPLAFGDWILDLTLGTRPGRVLELYAGTAPVVTQALARGLEAHGVELSRETCESTQHAIGPMLCEVVA